MSSEHNSLYDRSIEQEIDAWAFQLWSYINGSRLERWMRNDKRQPILFGGHADGESRSRKYLGTNPG